jgi:hypothetical protein
MIMPAEITTSDVHTSLVVPALIADIGDDASWRYVEFFTANIRNPHTRRAYVRACSRSSSGATSVALRSRRSGHSTSPPI